MTQPINLFDYEAQATKKLSQMALDYYASGACDEITLAANHSAFQKFEFLPRLLVDVSHRNLSTKVLGHPLSMPLIAAPTAFHCLAHPDGEIATVKAISEQNTAMVLSTLSTRSLEDVAASANNAPLWFQLYVHKDKELTRSLVERASEAGFKALCLTVDAPLLGRRERDHHNAFTLPSHLEMANLTKANNPSLPNNTGRSGLFDYFAQQLDPSLSWKDLEWLASISDLPVIVKGIIRADDAARSVEHGAKAVIVSNHGGRQLDGTISTIEALPDVVAAVGDKTDVLIDGGIRRGTDILKALALGAKAVLIGRPILWGLAVDGQQGVHHVLQLLREELDLAMALCGCPTLADIDSSLVRQNNA